MYLVIANHLYDDSKVMFLIAPSLNKARSELPRFSEFSGYQTLYKARWATREDVKKYKNKLKNIRDWEIKKIE